MFVCLKPINQLPVIYDIQEQEQEDELEKCRQHAAANIPVIIVNFISRDWPLA